MWYPTSVKSCRWWLGKQQCCAVLQAVLESHQGKYLRTAQGALSLAIQVQSKCQPAETTQGPAHALTLLWLISGGLPSCVRSLQTSLISCQFVKTCWTTWMGMSRLIGCTFHQCEGLIHHLQPQESIYTKRNLPIIPPIVRNYKTFFFGIRTPDTSSSSRTFIQSQNVFSGVTGTFVTY